MKDVMANCCNHRSLSQAAPCSGKSFCFLAPKKIVVMAVACPYTPEHLPKAYLPKNGHKLKPNLPSLMAKVLLVGLAKVHLVGLAKVLLGGLIWGARADLGIVNVRCWLLGKLGRLCVVVGGTKVNANGTRRSLESPSRSLPLAQWSNSRRRRRCCTCPVRRRRCSCRPCSRRDHGH